MRRQMAQVAQVARLACVLACADGCAIIDAVQEVPAFTVAGTLAGLQAGNGVVLENAGKSLPLTQNGGFAFSQKLANKAAYAISVAQQPNGQFCAIAGGSGTIQGADVKATVSCFDGSGPGDANTSNTQDSNDTALTVTVSSDSPAVADGTDTVDVTVTLRNRAQAPVSGREVVVSSAGAALTISPSSGVSDANGLFLAHISTTLAQSATADILVAGITQHVAIAFAAGPPAAAHIDFVANPNAVQANGSSASVLTVHVGDAYDNPVPNQPVSFSNSDGAHPPSPASTVTGSDGVATANLTSTTPGLQAVSATVAGVTLQGKVRFTGPPSATNCTFSASPNTLLANGMASSSIALVVRDASGYAIGGQPVRVTATGRGHALTVANANTQSDGSFASSLTATHAETKSLQVNLPGNANFAAQITFTAGGVSQGKSGIGAFPRTVVANGSATTDLRVLLTDAQGNGIANTPVSLQATGSNNTLTLPSLQRTDAYGVFRAQLASTNAEIKTLQASGSGFVLSTTVNFVNTPAACQGTLMLPQGPRQGGSGTNARALVAADFNADGQPDVAYVNDGSATVALFINDGNTFTARPPFTVSGHPYNLAAADLNGDGKAELVVSSSDAGTVEVFDASGSSQQVLTTGLAASLVVAQIRGDSAPDLAVSSNGNLLVYPGSHGGFDASGVTITPAQNLDFSSLAAGDVNNDTYADLLAAYQTNVTVFLGNGSGALTNASTLPNMGSDFWTAVADLNGDGRLDVLSSGAYALGHGDGTFGVSLSYPSGYSLGLQFDVTDYDGDHRLDLAGTGQAGLLIAPGTGSGAFTRLFYLPIGPGSAATVARDFNADGNTDFAVLDGQLNSFTVALGAGRGFFQSPSPTPTDNPPTGMALDDYNNDGVVDVLLTTDASAVYLAGKTNGSFAPAVTLPMPVAGNVGMVLGDFDGNGRPDIASLQPANGTVTLVFNDDPNGLTNATPFIYATGKNPRALAAADLNGDGRADLLVANANDNSVSLFLAGAGGYLQAPTAYATHTAPNGVVVGYFDSDAYPDVAVSNQNSNDVSILLGSASGGLSTATHYPCGPAPAGLVSADFNGDSKADLATFNRASNGNVALLLGNGDGTLQAASASVAAGPNLRGLTPVDLNGDGHWDLTWVNGGASTLRVAYGSGSATLSSPVTYDTWDAGPGFLGSADINGDSKPDGVVVHTTHPGFTVLLSSGCN